MTSTWFCAPQSAALSGGLDPADPPDHGGCQPSRAYTRDHARYSFAWKSGHSRRSGCVEKVDERSLAALPAPKPAVLAAFAVAGVAAAATTLALGLTNDEVDHGAIRVFLNDWITLNFIGAGLIAWWRRPDSLGGVS